jgi:hypothetical protein
VKLDWFYSVEHLTLLAVLFLLFLVVKGLDRLRDTLDSFHEDYRKVNNLDEREDSELSGRLSR